MKLRFTKHALARMRQRHIDEELVESVVDNPEVSLLQEDGCLRHFKYIEKYGHYLRIVCKGDLVITVMPGRNFKGAKK